MKNKSASKIIAEKTIFAVFNILKQAGGQMRGKEVIDKARETFEFNDYEKHIYRKPDMFAGNLFYIFIQLIV
jgi:restriction system protein